MTDNLKLTEQHRPMIEDMQRRGVSIRTIAERFGVNHMTVRRFLDPDTYRDSRPAKMKQEKDAAKYGNYDPIRLNDSPSSLTGYLMGDPSPERLRFVHGDRF